MVPKSASRRAGIIFPVARILKCMKKSGLIRTRLFRKTSAIYLAAVIEYLVREIAELAGDVTHQQKRKIITPRHVMLAVLTDSELSKSLRHVTFPFSGVIPQSVTSQLLSNAPTRQKVKRDVPRLIKPATVAKVDKRKPRSNSAIPVLSERQITNRTKLSVVSGNLAEITASVALHPTSSSLNFGGMVGTALLSAAGQGLQAIANRSIREYGQLDVCGVRLTEACNLPFPWILHCESPSWNPNDVASCTKQLNDLITACFETCDSKSLSSVAVPSVASGRNGFPKVLAAQTILRAIKNYCDLHSHNTNISEVIFVLYDQESVQIYRSEMHRLA